MTPRGLILPRLFYIPPDRGNLHSHINEVNMRTPERYGERHSGWRELHGIPVISVLNPRQNPLITIKA